MRSYCGRANPPHHYTAEREADALYDGLQADGKPHPEKTPSNAPAADDSGIDIHRAELSPEHCIHRDPHEHTGDKGAEGSTVCPKAVETTETKNEDVVEGYIEYIGNEADDHGRGRILQTLDDGTRADEHLLAD